MKSIRLAPGFAHSDRRTLLFGDGAICQTAIAAKCFRVGPINRLGAWMLHRLSGAVHLWSGGHYEVPCCVDYCDDADFLPDAAIVERRMPSCGWWMGYGMAFCGVLVLVDSRFGYAEPGVTLRGDLLCLASAICGSAGYIAGSRLTAVIGTWGTTFWGLAFLGVLSTIVILVVPTPTDWSTVSTFGYATIAYFAIFGSILGYVAWYWALARGGAMRIGPIQLLLPVIALTVAVLGLGEVLTLPSIVAAVAIFGGIAVAQRS